MNIESDGIENLERCNGDVILFFSELESFEPEAESVSTSAPKSRRRFEDFLKGVLK